MVLTLITVIIGILGMVGSARIAMYGDSLRMWERGATAFVVLLSYAFLVCLVVVRVIQL